MKNKPRLLALIDSKEYTLNEIYQGQLYEELPKHVDLTIVCLDEIVNKTSSVDVKSFDGIYCSIRYRNTLKYVNEIQIFLKDTAVIVNDYDTWVNYIDGSPYKNTYKIVNDALNVKYWFTSANWWAEKLKSDGYPAIAMKLGMKPSLIENTKRFEDKSRLIEFRGSKHEPRVIGHNKLVNAGFKLPWLSSIKPYSAFLESINDLKIWAHNESEPILIDGVEHSFNALWPKAVEVLSRGCFVIRDTQEEATWYDMNKLPIVFLYDNVNNANKKLEEILSLSEDEKNNRIQETIIFLKKQDYWKAYSQRLVEYLEA